ncbi:MAG: hypothetical protein K2O95_06605, partial [Clostridia bacterium]|nr:hypothetical protein [Clostridia bacterium]
KAQAGDSFKENVASKGKRGFIPFREQAEEYMADGAADAEEVFAVRGRILPSVETRVANKS